MNIFSVVMAAVAPGFALLAYFYLKDRYHSEPLHLVGRLFLLGMIIVFPTIILQRTFINAFGENQWVFSFLISGGLEEFLKWFVIYFVIYKHTSFDEPYDGIVYAVAVSLGFATLENIFYAVFQAQSFTSLFVRALLPVSGHALFGVLMGYRFGKAKFNPSQERKFLALALLLPMLWHGAFDYILMEFTEKWYLIMIPFMGLLWLQSMWKVERANSVSPYRTVYREDEVKI